jgi:hypothetical protein
VKTFFARIGMYIVLVSTSMSNVQCMDNHPATGPFSLTNSGERTFIAHVVYVVLGLRREIGPLVLNSGKSVALTERPAIITVEVKGTAKKLFTTFTPSQDKTTVIVQESPEDHALCAIMNQEDTQMLEEQDFVSACAHVRPTPVRFRPQTVPANIRRHH